MSENNVAPTNKTYTKRKPKVIHEYPDLPRNNSPKFANTHFKCRVIEYPTTKELLDLRHYTLNEGFSTIGNSFTLEQMEALAEILPHAIRLIKNRRIPNTAAPFKQDLEAVKETNC